MQNTCLPSSPVQRLTEHLVAGLSLELDLTPKPGLVDRRDSGSHPDLSYAVMARSIALLGNYFSEFALALAAGRTAESLRRIGMAAEARMIESFGTNTHRGAIFLGGVLLAGIHRAEDMRAGSISRSSAAFAMELFVSRLPTGTIGAQVRERYGAGGIVAEALDGLPCVFQVGVPALREAGQYGWTDNRALYLLMSRLMQTVQDTTTLRRCGPSGLVRLKEDGTMLEALLLTGADPVPFLVRINEEYRRCRMTMGGVADLMGLCAAWALFSRDWRPELEQRVPAAAVEVTPC